MKRFQGVTRRAGSSVWQWSIKVPADLQTQYPTQWAHRCSLGTTDLREANERASALQAKWTARFAEQRRALNPTRVEQVSPELAATLAARIRAAVVSRDDAVRESQAGAFLMSGLARMLAEQSAPVRFLSDPPALPADLLPDSTRSALAGITGAQADGLAQANASMDGLAAQALVRRNLAAVVPLVEREALRLGITFDAATPGAREALGECLKAYRLAWQDVSRRDAGDVVETPNLPQQPAAAPAVPAHTPHRPVYLRDVLARWKASKRRKPETEAAAERALALYEEATGNPPLSQLTRTHGADFKAKLLARGGASSTAADRLDYVKGFLNFACNELEAIPRNPWTRLSIDFQTENPRRPWSTEDLQRLAATPLVSSYALPAAWRAGQDAAYWLPLIGLFAGARVSELAQLRIDDAETVDGIAVLRITDEAAGASVKTAAGRRLVPVHDELRRLGFLEYVAALREAGASAMWPALRYRSGKPGGYFSQWFGEFRRAIDGPALPDFHSLRHTVRSRLASEGVSEPLIDSLVGHEVKGSTGAKTYTHRTTADLKRAIDRLSYPGLSLPRVFKAPAWKPND